MVHTILIVDDNIDDIELTSLALAATGRELRTMSARSGATALQLMQVENNLPELILLDLNMHGMSGIDTLRKIREDSRMKNIRVVILTSSSLESDRDESYKAGADLFIQKAFDIDQFNRDIRSLMDRCLQN
jgi:two-component system, response regulator